MKNNDTKKNAGDLELHSVLTLQIAKKVVNPFVTAVFVCVCVCVLEITHVGVKACETFFGSRVHTHESEITELKTAKMRTRFQWPHNECTYYIAILHFPLNGTII